MMALLAILQVVAMNASVDKTANDVWTGVKGLPPYDYVTLTPVFKTAQALYTLGTVSSGGVGYHVGTESEALIFEVGDLPENCAPVKDALLKYITYDMYKDTVESYCDTTSMNQFFELVEEVKYTQSHYGDISVSHAFTLRRGGRYGILYSTAPAIIQVSDTVDIIDEPGMHVRGDVAKLGSDYNFLAEVTTGYPFNPDTLSGNEWIKWTVARQEKDSSLTTILAGDKKMPHLKNADRPLLAGIDTVNFIVGKELLTPGKYKIKFTSDFPTANQNITFDINDTLRATVALDRNEYTCGKDSMALLHIKMDYKYPHISSTKIYPEPTIRIKATMNDSKDSLLLSNDTLATKDLMYAGDWTVKFKAVPESELKNGVAHEMMNVTISFNGQQQYAISLPMTFLLATDINQPTADEPNSTPADEYGYNLAGQRVAKGYRGLIIKKGKKYMPR